MANELTAFLRAASSRRFEPGRFDCGLWLADWLQVKTGRDVAADLRQLTPDAWVRAAARLPVTVGRVIRRAGGAVVRAPALGDIAVLRFDGAFVGALRTGLGWAVLTQSGLAISRGLDDHVVRIWRVDA
jgi:hypothetical protein